MMVVLSCTHMFSKSLADSSGVCLINGCATASALIPRNGTNTVERSIIFQVVHTGLTILQPRFCEYDDVWLYVKVDEERSEVSPFVDCASDIHIENGEVMRSAAVC